MKRDERRVLRDFYVPRHHSLDVRAVNSRMLEKLEFVGVSNLTFIERSKAIMNVSGSG